MILSCRWRLTPALLVVGSLSACNTVEPSPSVLDPPRLFRARLSIEGEYRPCDQVPTAAPSPWECHFSVGDRIELVRSARRALARAEDAPGRYRHRLLLAALTGDEEKILAEVETSREADVQSDRSALLHSLARREDRPDLLPLAFEAAYRAVELDPGNRRALYNLALLLDDLGMREQSREASSRLLELETEPGWRAEIEAFAETGGRTPARQIDAAWLPPHYTLTSADLEAARQVLDLSRQAEATSSITCGDRGLPGSAGFASKLLQRTLRSLCRGDVADRLALATSVLHLEQAFSMIEQSRLEEGRRALEEAAAELQQFGSPLATLAAVESAAVLYNQGERSAAIARLEPALAAADCAAHPQLRARASWLLGMTRYVTGSREEGGALLAATARFYEEHDQPTLSGIVNALTADAYKPIGNDFLTWRSLERSLRSLDRIEDPVRVMQILNIAADVARFAGSDGLALHLQRESLAFALRTSDPSLEGTALNWLAAVEHRAEHPDAAWRSLQAARSVAPEVDDPGRRGMLEAETNLVEGLILTDRDPKSALEPLTMAAEFYSQRNHVFSTLAKRALARSLRALDRQREALDALHDAIGYLERVQSGVSRDSLSLTLASSWQGPFDEAVSILLDMEEPTSALLMAERARLLSMRTENGARSVRGGGKDQIGSVQRLRESIPESTVVVALESLSGGIASWLITPSKVEFDWTEVDAGRFEAVLSDLRGLDASGAAYLSQILTDPWIDRVPEEEHLVLVPDRDLEVVPFSRLRVPGHEYLVDRNSMEVALTLSGWQQGLGARSLRIAADLRPGIVVAHGDEHDARLKDLPDEVLQVERAGGIRYDGVGHEAADGVRLRSFMSQQKAIHIVGHSLSDRFGPRIRLGDTFGPELELRPSELGDLPLDRVFLVTLSACSTHRSGVTREEVASLARPLLLAGVRLVGASLWNIRDDVARDFYVGFYQALESGTEIEEAFWRSQQGLRRRPDLHPSDWAAFQLMTGGIN